MARTLEACAKTCCPCSKSLGGKLRALSVRRRSSSAVNFSQNYELAATKMIRTRHVRALSTQASDALRRQLNALVEENESQQVSSTQESQSDLQHRASLLPLASVKEHENDQTCASTEF